MKGSAAGSQVAWSKVGDTGRYAPNYRVKVAGLELDPLVIGDILDINVTLEKGKPAAFTLNVNDWDDKTVYREPTTSPKAFTKYSSGPVFDLARTVGIELGYADELWQVVYGSISSLSVRFPESGSPTLTVGGQDALRDFANRKPTAKERKHWENVRDGAVVEEISKRLGLPSHVDPDGPIEKVIAIKNQDYASFLLERADKSDHELYIELAPPEAHDKLATLSSRESRQPVPTLFFVKRRDGRNSAGPSDFMFEWGRNLLSYTPRLSDTRLVESVTVRGWDPETKSPIVFKADRSHLPKSASGEGSGVTKARKGSNDVMNVESLTSVDEARKLAVAELMRRSNTFHTGSAKVVGEPRLRPGMLVSVTGLGPRFDLSRAQVTKVVHTLGGGGFLTEFEVAAAVAGEMPAATAAPKARR